MTKETNNIDSDIAYLLEKLMQVQRILLWDVAKKENLSPIQIQILLYLSCHDDELRTVSVLAHEFDLTKATVSDAVTTLTAKNLVTKNILKDDKRSYILDLTPGGKALSKKIEKWQNTLLYHIGKIKPDTKDVVYGFLVDLIKTLFDSGIISTARMCLTCANFSKGSGSNNCCMLTNRKFSDRQINFDCEGYKSKEAV